jgi:hypothetical protein
MTALILTPLVLVAIVVLFRSVGCTLDRSGLLEEAVGWDYDGTVLSHANLAGYWRLGEAAGTTASDETGAHDGTYDSATLVEDGPAQSPAAPGVTTLGAPGMIASDAAHTSVNVDGGYVEVPFAAPLNTPQFSIEVWAAPDWDPAETVGAGAKPFRCLMASREVSGGAARGFALYAGPDLTVPGDTTFRWQVWVGDGGPAWQRLVGPAVDFAQPTHLAVTYDSTTLRLFVNGSEDEAGTPDASMAVGYDANTSSPLYIGMGAPEAATPQFPFKGRLQEAAVYNAALTPAQVDDRVIAGTTTGP